MRRDCVDFGGSGKIESAGSIRKDRVEAWKCKCKTGVNDFVPNLTTTCITHCVNTSALVNTTPTTRNNTVSRFSLTYHPLASVPYIYYSPGPLLYYCAAILKYRLTTISTAEGILEIPKIPAGFDSDILPRKRPSCDSTYDLDTRNEHATILTSLRH